MLKKKDFRRPTREKSIFVLFFIFLDKRRVLSGADLDRRPFGRWEFHHSELFADCRRHKRQRSHIQAVSEHDIRTGGQSAVGDRNGRGHRCR